MSAMKLNLLALSTLWFATHYSLAASIYSSNVIVNIQPDVYWEFEETSGPTTPDISPFGASPSGSYVNATLGNPGPRPSGGFIGMNSSNLAAGVATSDNVQNTQLETVGGISTGAYSASIWFNSAVAFSSQVLHYFMGRGIDNTSNGGRDWVGVGGSFGSTSRLFWTDGPSGGSPGIVSGPTILSPNTWYNVTMVRDDSLPSEQIKVYLNGQLELSSDFAWLGGTGDIFRFGNRTDTNTGLGLDGLIDEGAIWNRALTAAEVATVYNLAFSDAVVPEPGTGLLMSIVGCALVRTQRRRFRRQ